MNAYSLNFRQKLWMFTTKALKTFGTVLLLAAAVPHSSENRYIDQFYQPCRG